MDLWGGYWKTRTKGPGSEHTYGTSPEKPRTNKGGEDAEPLDSSDCFESASIPSESGPKEQIDQTTPTTLVESEQAPVTESATPRRSTIERRLPARFKDYAM